jgi:hypothetical protein
MLLFHRKLFHVMLEGTEERFSSPDLYGELSEAQQFAVTLRTSEFGTSVGVLYGLGSSLDGSLFNTVASGSLWSATKDVITYSQTSINSPPIGPYTRFSISLDSGFVSGLCEVWVTGRAKDYRGRTMVSMRGAYGETVDQALREGALPEEAVEALASARSPHDWSPDGTKLAIGGGITPHAERDWRPRTELGDAGTSTSIGTAPAAAFAGPGGAPNTGTLDDRLREVGRLLDITRDLDALRELRDRTMFEVIDSITEGGLSAELANSLLGQRLGAGVAERLTTDLPGSTTGARQRVGYTGTLDPMDWRSYGESEGGSRDPFGLGRWGFVADSIGNDNPAMAVERAVEGSAPDEQPGAGVDVEAGATVTLTPHGDHVHVERVEASGQRSDYVVEVGKQDLSQFSRGVVARELVRDMDPASQGSSALGAFLLSRIGSPGVSWSPPPSKGGAARVRPQDPEHAGSASAAPQFTLHRGALVGVERRAGRGQLTEDQGQSWIERFARPQRP